MPESLIQVTEGVAGKRLHTNARVVGSYTLEDGVREAGEQYLASYTGFTIGQSTAVANSHLLQLMATASLSLRIRRIEVHQSVAATAATLADFRVISLTTAGTGGNTVSCNRLNNSDAAYGSQLSGTTVKGTEGATVAFARPYLIQTIGATTPFKNPIIVWDFDQDRGQPLIVPIGAANGICVENMAAYAGASVQTMVWFDTSTF